MKDRLTVVSVYNDVQSSNTPLEPFVHTDTDKFVLYVLSLYQGKEDTKRELYKLYPEVDVSGSGIGATRFTTPLKIFRLVRSLRRMDPDVIHVNHTWSGILASLLGRIFTRAKILTTAHNDFRFYKKYQKVLWFLTYVFSNCIACNSANTRNCVMNVGGIFLRRKPCLVCYNGVDVSAIDDALKRREPEVGIVRSWPFLIGAVGRSAEQKGFDTLIRAYGLLKNRIPQAGLVIIGDGPIRHDLESLAKELNVSNRVIFTGNIPRERVYSFLGCMDVFVVSSRWEGFCNAMVEAMAAGKAIIASRVEPLPEVLGEDCGLFFEAGDQIGLCEGMRELYENLSLRRELGDKARMRALQRFTLEKTARNYEMIYEMLCAKRDE